MSQADEQTQELLEFVERHREDIEFVAEHKETIRELQQAKENNQISRRQAVALLASGVGIGGLSGGLAVSGARADASTGDNDGNVGWPNDRVDVFADGVDAIAVDTDEVSGGVSSTAITNFEGANLSVDSNGNLDASASGMRTQDGSVRTASGANSITVNLNSNYDNVKVFVESVDKASSSNDTTLALDGETGTNYDEVTWTGTKNNSVDPPTVYGHGSGTTNRAEITITGRYGSQAVAVVNSAERISPGIDAELLLTNRPSSPLDSFTFSRGASTDWRVEAWGKNV